MIKLSILVPSTHTRFNTFLPKIQEQLYSQYNALSKQQQDQVEILVLVDNKKILLGEKRNIMVDMAQGEYVVHVDCDDRLEPDYIESLLNATKTGVDVITFKVSVSLNGAAAKICHYSKGFLKDHNTWDAYFRLPNHICCIKREVCQKVSFPNILYGEDAVFAQLLLPHIQTEHIIDRVLYHYDYNELTTETQMHVLDQKLRKRKLQQDAIIDIIFLSDAKTPELRELTEQALRTCYIGANGLATNIIVVESCPGVNYEDATTIYHDAPFNYNAFANIGIRTGQAKWVMVANNDLIFEQAWLHNLLAAEHELVSPHEPTDERQRMITANTIGTQNGTHFSGWCFAMTRDLYDRIGGLDESTHFWAADDATIEQCIRVGIQPMIVKNAVVRHLGSTTFKTLDAEKQEDYTWGSLHKFNQSFAKDKFSDNQWYKQWKEKQSGLE